MDDFFDDFEGMNEAWDDEPDFKEEQIEAGDGFWNGPGEQDCPLIFGISEDIAREKRDIERARREWDDQEEDYWDMINRKW